MMELLDDNTIIYILKYLHAPSDVAHASTVSRSWRQHVLEGQLWRGLCHREFPELEMIQEVIEIDIPRGSEGAGCSHVYQSTLEKNHRVYNQLYREIMKTPVSDRNCIAAPIAASSTDKFPQEGIRETLHPNPRRILDIHDTQAWSYWSSKGQKDPNVPETLTYNLIMSLCLVHEIRIRPFKAEFQHEDPVYSPKYVRFRLGYEVPRPSSPEEKLRMEAEGNEPREFPWPPGCPPEYTWTYVSPEYLVEQRDELQVFKLPRPVLCMGQILQVELLERVQAQLEDLLYYICVCHVKVVGKPIKNFGFSPPSAGRACSLICQRGIHLAAVLPKPDTSDHVSAEDGAGARGGRHYFAGNSRLSRGFLRNTYVLNRILGNLAVASLLLATEEYFSDEDEMSEEDLDEDDDLQDDDEPGYLF